MTIVVACGAFKGSLTAIEACHHAAEGARRAHPDTDVVERPVADGGGGSLEVMVAGGARPVPVTASGPTGDPVETSFAAIDPDTAFVEMADACGLLRLPGDTPRPLEASSRGVGEVLLAALRSGRGNIHLGIGGSASTDGGTGMLSALGVRFLDADGAELPDGGGSLVQLDRVDLDGLDPAVRVARVLVACDVDNPLLGPLGAAEMPTTRGRNHVEHASGTRPRRVNTNPNLAVSAAMRTSVGKVMVTPTPAAEPLIAEMTGLVMR